MARADDENAARDMRSAYLIAIPGIRQRHLLRLPTTPQALSIVSIGFRTGTAGAARAGPLPGRDRASVPPWIRSDTERGRLPNDRFSSKAGTWVRIPVRFEGEFGAPGLTAKLAATSVGMGFQVVLRHRRRNAKVAPRGCAASDQAAPLPAAPLLHDLEQLDLEDQRGAALDHGRSALITVGDVRGAHEPALAAHLHHRHALGPAANHALEG